MNEEKEKETCTPVGVGIIKSTQMDWYKSHKCGCSFAALAAKDPDKYGWKQIVTPDKITNIELDAIIDKCFNDDTITTVSLIFPNMTTIKDIKDLMAFMCTTSRCIYGSIYDGEFTYEELRFKHNDDIAWVSGFAPLECLPKTRQAPYTELAFRCSPKPTFDYVLKETPKHILHLADLDLLGISDAVFRSLWASSFKITKKLLGRKPTRLEAAKTTYAYADPFLT